MSTLATYTTYNDDTNFSSSSSTQKIAQPFQVTLGGTLTEIKLNLEKNGSPTGNITCKLYADNGSGLPGTVLDTSTNTVASTGLPARGSNTLNATFTFSGGVRLDTATDYWIELESTVAFDTSNYVWVGIGNTSTPSGWGGYSFWNGSSWSAKSTNGYRFVAVVSGTPDLTDGLVSYWKLDGNSTDAVGSNNGTDASITYSTGNGKIGQGAGFNGSSSKISLGTGTLAISPTSGDFTISAWVKLAATGATQAIFGRPDQARFDVTTGSKAHLLVEETGRTVHDVTGTTTLSTGTLYHVVGVVTAGSKMEVFLNAVSDGSNTSSIPSAYYNQTAATVGIGFLANAPDTAFFNGAIDEVGFWNRALSSTEISQLYNSGSGLQYPFVTSVASNSAFLLKMV